MAAGQNNQADQERELVEAARADPRRFAELYELWFDRVWAYVIRRLRDRHEAEDVTSEVFEQALAQINRYEWRGVPFGAWLFRIASARIADRRRKSIVRPPEAEPVSGEDIEEACHRARLFALVRGLPPDQAGVLEARFVEGKTTREIAGEMGRSEGAVKQLQFRGLETLRAQITGESHD
jgi:RNA polymerase sigma-70 factor, ECF subfamily